MINFPTLAGAACASNAAVKRQQVSAREQTHACRHHIRCLTLTVFRLNRRQ